MPLLLLSAACVSGCGSRGDVASAAAVSPAPAAADWRQIATDSDRNRVRNWRTAWMRGLAQAQGAGHGAEITREGRLLQPDAAAEWRDPPSGDYDCRVIKVGSKTGAGTLDYVAYPPFLCRIRNENGMMSFAKLTGSQRPLGLLLPAASGANRMIFLGTLQLGDESRALQYGRDRERDMAGVIERIGERKWRLVFPYPHFESTIDVLELTPKA